jgi:hypothetical protein
MPANTSPQELRLTAFSIVGQCLFYHFADPVTRNLLTADEYAVLDIDRLAQHITQFSLAAFEGQEQDSRTPRRARTGAAQ